MAELTETQERAMIALLATNNRQDAARNAGITQRTLQRYLRSDTFRQRYRNELAALSEDARRTLAANMSAAASTLDDIRQDEEQPGSVRVAACRAILEYGERMQTDADIIERIERLEHDTQE